uniref:Uncharacterized protein n=1 Tax=Kalanchoe fedtschenkoi TaxID=63787 RepID=A0A7N0V023_KALFE
MILVPRRQLIWSGVMFTIGVGLTSYGGYMSMVNIGPSQERFRARRYKDKKPHKYGGDRGGVLEEYLFK